MTAERATDPPAWTDPWGQPAEHLQHLLAFARRARLPQGFGRLDDHGGLATDSAEVLITARMGIVFAVGTSLFGRDEDRRLAQHAVTFLAETLPQVDLGYELCFTVTAAATAAAADVPGAGSLLTRAVDRLDADFWSEQGYLRYQLSAPSPDEAGYVGANVAMHGVEALLALDHVRPGPDASGRAAVLAETFVDRAARAAGWMLPEHFRVSDTDPEPRLWSDFHRDRPLDEFRPYGVTPGHQVEWARLLLELRSALGDAAPVWCREAAGALFTAAQTGFVDGWGFVYTMEPDGTPVNRVRPHWVQVEAVASAAVLAADGHIAAAELLPTYRRLATSLFLDTSRGSWHHEVDEDGSPGGTLFTGKPDVYHALQSVLVHAVPAGRSLAERAAAGVPGQRPSGPGASRQ